MQIVWKREELENNLDKLTEKRQGEKILLVCGKSFLKQDLWKVFEKRSDIVLYQQFEPNPSYESVVSGVEQFHKHNCDCIVAAGGGSAIDVAKCIKLYSNMNPDTLYLTQEIVENSIPLIAIPTTAGTGSESTQFAVIYYKGEKQSVSHKSIIPAYVVFDQQLLKSLPDYHKKASMLDALCHGIESFWSVNSTQESRNYSSQAIGMIRANQSSYMNNEEDGLLKMLMASNLAGQAINITQTTAAHAMCYKMTKLYGFAHGHSAAVCLIPLWKHMLEHMEQCTDPRGSEFVEGIFVEIAHALNVESAKQAIAYLSQMLDELHIQPPSNITEEEMELLVSSVNIERLKNNPVGLTAGDIKSIYQQMKE